MSLHKTTKYDNRKEGIKCQNQCQYELDADVVLVSQTILLEIQV